MDISFIAFNRIAENKAAKDPKYRRELQRNGRPLLSQARHLTDAELLAKLRAVGIELDKTSYLEHCENALSAEEMCRVVVTSEVRRRFKHRFDEDWVWFALTVLWERWFPGLPNYEQLDDLMQSGYSLSEADSVAACENWFLAWDAFRSLYNRGDFTSLDAFDAAFRGTQFISNWVQDFETELLNAAEQDARWQQRRMEFCGQFLHQFSVEGDLTTENMRRALAEAAFSVRGPAEGDALFEQWLKHDPQWGWGWIGWADCYFLFATDPNCDLQRAEELLKRALNVPGVRDYNDILDRLGEFYEEQGRNAEAEAIRARLAPGTSTVEVGDKQLSVRTKLDFGEEGLPLDQLPNLAAQLRNQHEGMIAPVLQPKVGRNDPCPCGSGKKYKKCCLSRDETRARQTKVVAQPADATSALASDAAMQADRVHDLADVPDTGGEAGLSPEENSKLNQVWDDFESLKQPTAGQMNEFLTQLLALPSEATSWSDVVHRLARSDHTDLAAVFRRIADGVPHTKATGMGFFYWAAAQEFARHGLDHLLPEVAAGFRKLDMDGYDADALAHVEDFLLAAGLDAEALQLAEHFLPIERADEGLMPYAVPRRCNLIFELRVGQSLRTQPTAVPSPETIARQLRKGIEEDIHEDSARHAAEIASGHPPLPAWTRSQFDLVTGDICEDEQAWRDCLRLFGMLIRVAQEAWQLDERPPGCAVRGLSLLLNSVYDWKKQRSRKSKKTIENLLDYLRPSGLERRLAESCREVIGINESRARLLLQAHELLVRFAARHELISPADAAQTEKELLRLRRALEVVTCFPV